MLVANFSNETLTLPKTIVLGIAERVREDEIDKINPKAKLGAQSVAKTQRQVTNEGLYEKLLKGKLDHLEKRLGST
jgi:hypothetical protein